MQFTNFGPTPVEKKKAAIEYDPTGGGKQNIRGEGGTPPEGNRRRYGSNRIGSFGSVTRKKRKG